MAAAERTGSHWTYISEIENGRRNPGIAAGLGVPLSAPVAAEAATHSGGHDPPSRLSNQRDIR